MHFWLDLRHTIRLLFKERAFAASVILTLALGIGVNTAIFSVINAALLRPLPFPNASRIFAIDNVSAKINARNIPICAGDYYDFASANQTFEHLGLIRFRDNFSLSVGTEPEAVVGHQ